MTKHGRLKPTASNTAIGRQYYQPNGMLHLERRCVYPSAGGVHSKWPDEVHACRMRRANVTPRVVRRNLLCAGATTNREWSCKQKLPSTTTEGLRTRIIDTWMISMYCLCWQVCLEMNYDSSAPPRSRRIMRTAVLDLSAVFPA